MNQPETRASLVLNPALRDLPVYQPGRPIEEVARELGLDPRTIAKLASNENPLGPSPLAIEAMQQAVSQLHLYPDGNAFYLKQKLAAKLGLEPGHLILGNGSNEIIEFLGHALVGPGIDVVMSQFCFAIYPIVTLMFGGRPVVVPAKAYGHDLIAMRQAITPQTRLVFVANPNNPTGTLATPEQVFGLIESVPPGVLLVIDEAYFEYLENPPDLLSLIRSGKHPNLLLMRTFSKIYGLAGLRLGYGIGSPELIAALQNIRQPFNTNSIAQAGALAALDDRAHLQRTRETNFTGMQFWQDALGHDGIEYVPSAGNFILTRVGDGDAVFRALQQRGVIVRPMGGYQLPEWVRISIGTQAGNERCLTALREVLAG